MAAKKKNPQNSTPSQEAVEETELQTPEGPHNEKAWRLLCVESDGTQTHALPVATGSIVRSGGQMTFCPNVTWAQLKHAAQR